MAVEHVFRLAGMQPWAQGASKEWHVFVNQNYGTKPDSKAFVTFWKRPKDDWQLISGVPTAGFREAEQVLLMSPHAMTSSDSARKQDDLLAAADGKRALNKSYLQAVVKAIEEQSRWLQVTKKMGRVVDIVHRSTPGPLGTPPWVKNMGEAAAPIEPMRCDMAIPTMQDLVLMEAAAKGKRDKQTGFPLVAEAAIKAVLDKAMARFKGEVLALKVLGKPQGSPIPHVQYMVTVQVDPQVANKAGGERATGLEWVGYVLEDMLIQELWSSSTHTVGYDVKAQALQGDKAAMAEGRWAYRIDMPAVAGVYEDVVQTLPLRSLLEKLEQRGHDTFVFTGKGARLTIGSYGETYRLEELPAKGKRRLRMANLGVAYMRGWTERAWDAMMAENVLADAKLADSDDFDAIKDKIEKAVARAKDEVLAKWEVGKIKPDWIKPQGKWTETTVPAGRVAPEGGDTELVVGGKDFTLKVTWKSFRAYSPDSDFQQSDPYYTGITERSPSAAAKLFKLLQAQPTALKGVAYKDFESWLNDHKIANQGIYSTWS